MNNSQSLRVAITPGSFTGKTHFLTRRAADHLDGSPSRFPLQSRIGVTSVFNQADIALFPFDLTGVLTSPESVEQLKELVADNGEHGLRTVCVMWNDLAKPIDIGQPQAMNFRPSMLRKLQYHEEFVIPMASSTKDFPTRLVTPRSYSHTPRVGFMGCASVQEPNKINQVNQAPPPDSATSAAYQGEPVRSNTDANRAKNTVSIGSIVRDRALKGVIESNLVDSEIVTRSAFFGSYSDSVKNSLRMEYIEHLARNDYILCPRGSGNYSHRVYETMAAGRIPVLIDTHLVMPFPDVIPWQEISVWVPLADIDRIDEHVVDFHEKLGESGHRDLQVYIRNLYEKYVSTKGTARHLESFLATRL